METRSQRGERIGEIALVITAVVDELVDGGIYVTVGQLVQP